MGIVPKLLLVALLLVVAFVIYVIFAWISMTPPRPKVSLNDPAMKTKLDEYFSHMNEAKLTHFNGAVLIRKGQDVLLRKGYGIDGYGRALTANSSFRLASVSKQFTAIGTLTLAENNQINLNDPISKYLPNCNYNSTITSLLNHTSGVPNVYMNIAKRKDTFVTSEDAVNHICEKHNDLVGPGKYEYSNTGYVFLARLIEVVSGETFENYMKTAVFEPLELTNTRVWNLTSEDDFSERAVGFNADKKEPKPVKLTHLDGVAGDGAIFSSLNDLENWARFWLDDRLISRDLKALAMTGGKGNYGFGVVQEGDVIWHNGAWLATNSYFYLNTENEDLIILIDNGDHVFTGSIADYLRRILEEG